MWGTGGLKSYSLSLASLAPLSSYFSLTSKSSNCSPCFLQGVEAQKNFCLEGTSSQPLSTASAPLNQAPGPHPSHPRGPHTQCLGKLEVGRPRIKLFLGSQERPAAPPVTYLSVLVLLGPRGLQKGAQVLLGHGEQRRACVHNGLAALGAPAGGLASNEEPEWRDERFWHLQLRAAGGGPSPPLRDEQLQPQKPGEKDKDSAEVKLVVPLPHSTPEST